VSTTGPRSASSLKRTNLLQARTVASGRRFAREVAQRLAVLTDDELELLVDSTTTERSHLLWPAACRRYDLIGNFASRVRALAVAEGFEPSTWCWSVGRNHYELRKHFVRTSLGLPRFVPKCAQDVPTAPPKEDFPPNVEGPGGCQKQPRGMDVPENDAAEWRDLAEQLTAEQVA
jgi:hypothetical protein